MRRGKILIVEDELIARENLDHVLKKEGYDTVAVESGVLAFKELEKQEFDLVMTDLKMQQVDGLQVLERTKELSPDTEVIMITGFATVSTAVEAMQKGAYHYLPKPYKIDEMRILVAKAMEKRSLRQEVTELKRQVQSQKAVPFLVGKSPKIELLKQTIEQIAPSDATVLILGETGTGKELVAKAIHHLSPRVRPPLPGHQLRGLQRRVAGQRALRPRKRSLHRGPGSQEGPAGSGFGGHGPPG